MEIIGDGKKIEFFKMYIGNSIAKIVPKVHITLIFLRKVNVIHLDDFDYNGFILIMQKFYYIHK